MAPLQGPSQGANWGPFSPGHPLSLLTQRQIQKPLPFKVWLLVPMGHVQKTAGGRTLPVLVLITLAHAPTQTILGSWGSAPDF